MTKKVDVKKRFAELNDCLNLIHQKGKKISYQAIAEELGSTQQWAYAKFKIFDDYIKSNQNMERFEQAKGIGHEQGFTLESSVEEVSSSTVELAWKCKEGHSFNRSITDMRFSNVLCPECKKTHGAKYKNKESI